MALPPKKERKLSGQKAKRQPPYQAAHSLDDCVSATVSGLSAAREVGLDDAPQAGFGRLSAKAESGRPESDLDHISSGFSTYLPQGKKREQRLRARMAAQGYAPTAQDADWDEPETQDPRAQSLSALYDAYGEDDAALAAAYDAYGAEDDEPDAPRAPRRVSRKAERQAQTLKGLKTMGALLAAQDELAAPEVLAAPEPPAKPEMTAPAQPEMTAPAQPAAATAPVSFAEHDALEDEALRDLLGPAYDAAVGAHTLLAPSTSEAPQPTTPEPSVASELGEDEALRDLLGPVYDAAVGAQTVLTTSAPVAPPAAPEPSVASELGEDEALRDLLGPAYDAAVGAHSVLAPSAPVALQPAAPEPSVASELGEDEALRDLLGSAYDAAMGAHSVLAPSAPVAPQPAAPEPSVASELGEDEALRDLLGPAYDAAVGTEPALAQGAQRADEQVTAPAPRAARIAPLPQSSAPAAPYELPPEYYDRVPPTELGPSDWVPPPLPEEAYALSDQPPWAGDEPPLPEVVPPLTPADDWEAPWNHVCVREPQVLAPQVGAGSAGHGGSRRLGASKPYQRRASERNPRLASGAAAPTARAASGRRAPRTAEPAVSLVKDLDEVSSSVGLHPYDPDALSGRRGRRGPEIKDLDGSASTVSMPYEQALSGYSIELDATGAGAPDAAPRRKGRGSKYRQKPLANSLDELSSSVTLPVGAQSAEHNEEPAASKRRSSRYSRRPKAPQVSSLDELSSSVTLPIGTHSDAPEIADAAAAAVSAAGADALGAADGTDEVTLAYNEMIRLLTAREYSAYELTRKCAGRFAAAAVATALARCQEQGFQSDERYADLLVRHMRLALYGSYKLRLEAQRKGVDWHLVEAALASNELDWYELAYECLRKKYTAADLTDYKTRVKANGFLGRRGFETAEREYALARLARGE